MPAAAGVKKMVSYFDSRAPPDNDKIHLFPVKSEIRGMNTSEGRSLGWRMHGSVEDTKLSTNKHHSLSTS